MSKRILIFYISRYSGHYQAARAIEEAFSELDKSTRVSLVNALDHTNPILGRIVFKLYIAVIRKKPEIWGSIYDNPDILKKVAKVRGFFHNFNKGKIKKLLDEFKPDTVYCTQAFPCGMVADFKRSSGKDLKLVAVLTDHAPHSYWLFDEVDIYSVPSEKTLEALVQKGVKREKIKVLGIPVNPKFMTARNKEAIRKDLGLSPVKPTVLVMGGGYGLGAIEAVVRSFMDGRDGRYQLLVVTGANKKLYKRLNALARKKENPGLRVFSYVENIDELMEISDIVITKAGGITTSEALAKKLPILIVDPIPGQEYMNTDYLVSSGAALSARDHADVFNEIDKLFAPGGGIGNMRKNAEKLAKPDSAMKIAQLAFQER